MSETEELEKLRLQNARYKAALEEISKFNAASGIDLQHWYKIQLAVEALKEVDK